MLDFLKLAKQVASLGADVLVEETEEQLLEAALAAYKAQETGPFRDKLLENSPWVLWPTARPLEEIHKPLTVPLIETKSQPWTAVGVDGSQIMPSHHEVHSCYLLNAGLARISYGLPLAPVLTSEPRLHARPVDLYPLVDRRRVHIDELFVSLERELFELETLAREASAAAAFGPVLAMFDGSLIAWSAEKMPPGYQEIFFERMENAFAQLKKARVPLVGYISQSRSSDVINCLRVAICPYELSNCREHCAHLNEEDFPCSRIWPLTDRTLYGAMLPPGRRGPVFLSGASAVKAMSDDDAICFVYFKGEGEIGRLEFPRWVFESDLFDFALSAAVTQIAKGQGYPLVLSEAHHLAVIKGPERERFFALLAAQMVSLGGKPHVSPKESRKRKGFV